MDPLRRLAFTPLLLGIHAAHLIALQVSAVTSGASRAASSSSSSSRNVQRCPRHVAFSIVTSHGRKVASSREFTGDGRSTVTCQTARSRKGKEKAEDVRWTTEEALVLQTVREAVTWALQNEVDEISLWNEDGLLQAVLPGLLAILVPSPPTPPASGTCSPPRSLSPDTAQETLSAPSSSFASSSEGGNMQTAGQHGTQSYTVWPDMEEMLKEVQVGQKLRLKPLSVHVLPTKTSEDMLAEMTQDLVRQDIPLEAITVEHMDDLIRDSLHFHTDPELLIVHHIPGSDRARPTDETGIRGSDASRSWRYKALSRLSAVYPLELHGYPFWMLRITEIYDSRAGERHAMGMDGWDRAMDRWRGVEQRLGR